MPPSGEALITAARGGKLTVDRVTVELPAGAVEQDITLRIVVKDLPPSPKYALFKYAFDLEGRVGSSPQGPLVTRFGRSPKVSIDYKGLGLTEEEQRRNLVWRYDEADKRWKPLALAARPAQGVVSLETSHFSSFAMGPTSDPIPPAPPGLQAYQTDLLTGASRTSYRIEVPPGMGGLTPVLELTYSSLVVDEMNRSFAQIQGADNAAFSQQASWVGLGWDFEPGCILSPSADAPRYIRIGSRSSRLIQDQPDGSWRTEDDWFCKVVLMTSGGENLSGYYWLAYDKEGTEYRFGFTLKSEHTIGGGYPYRNDLDRIKDARGNYIEYLWDETTDNHSGTYDSDRDFWLTEIRYTGNAAQSMSPQRCIVFNPEIRTDYYDGEQGQNYVHRKRLASIEIFGDIARTPAMRVSKYVFAYGYDNPWWHRFNDQGGDIQVQAASKLLLLSITRYGADGTSALPATTFTYYSGLSGLPAPKAYWKPWLKTANNGYGGKATYTYEYFTPTNFQYQWLKYRARLATLQPGRKWEDLGITGNPAVEHTYRYGDSYDFMETWNHAPRAEFRGHDWVDEVDALGHYTRSWFYTFRSAGQTQNGKTDAEVHILKGRMYKQERYDSASTLLAYDTSDWNYVITGTAADGSNSYFIKMLQQDSYLGSKHKQVELVYDDVYGNVLREYYNRYITGEPQKTVRRGFFADTARWIISKISWESVFDGIITQPDNDPIINTWKKLRHWGYNPTLDVFHTAAQITNGLVYKTRDYYHEGGQELSILTQYGYDPYGNRTSATNPNNNTNTYVFDSTYHAFVTQINYPITGLLEQRGYNLGRGILTSVTDSNGQVTEYAYDTFGRIEAMARPGDSLVKNAQGQYDRATRGFVYYDGYPFQVLTSTRKIASGPADPSGYHTARTFYDGLGREAQRYSDAVSGHISVNTYYDSRGLKRRETVPHAVTGTGLFLQNDWTNWQNQGTGNPGVGSQYDALRRPTVITNPDSTQQTTSYSGWDLTRVDENSHKKVQKTDAFGRMVVVEEYIGANPWSLYATTSYGYNVLDNLTSVTDAMGNVTSITWNELSRKTQMADPDMGIWKYQQDAAGNTIRQEDARGKVIKIGYDALNRPRRKTLWRVENNQDVLEGNWVDELSINNTIGIYDIAEMRAAINANRAGLESSDPTRKPRTWEGLQGETDPDNRTFIAGRTTVRAPHFTEMLQALRDLKSDQSLQFTRGQVVAGGPRTISVQDPLDLRTWVGQHEGNNGVASRVYIRYDDYTGQTQYPNAKGRRTEIWDASGHTLWKYDTRGRVIEERRYIDGKVYVTTWTYDAMDRVTSMTYPDGETVNYTYNAQLLLDSMAGTNPYIAAGTGYNAAGLPTSVTYNGVTTSLGYHAQTLRLTSISVPSPVNLTLGYEHYSNGNISRITENTVPTDFGYDELDRLTSASGAFSASYTIDQIGRLFSKSEGGVPHAMLYQDGNHKHAPSSVDGAGQSYDEDGNLIASSGLSLKYNAENHLVKVSQGSAYVGRFICDGDGQRRKRVDNFGTVIYVGPHYERNVGTGADTSDVATKMYWAQLGPYRRLIAVRKGGTLSFVHHDHLGSTKAISGSTGGPMKYYPFGSTYQEISSPPTDNLYTGQKRDLSTGLYFYGARYYQAAYGLFTQPDSVVPQPGNPQSLNRYSYVLNNPLRYADPSGHSYREPPLTVSPLQASPPPVGPMPTPVPAPTPVRGGTAAAFGPAPLPGGGPKPAPRPTPLGLEPVQLEPRGLPQGLAAGSMPAAAPLDDNWNAVNNLIGGALGALSGEATSRLDDGSITLYENVSGLTGAIMSGIGGDPITIGNVILTKGSLEYGSETYRHERAHAQQAAMLGPLYLPAYAASAGLAIAFSVSVDPKEFWRYNIMEWSANEIAGLPNDWPGE